MQHPIQTLLQPACMPLPFFDAVPHRRLLLVRCSASYWITCPWRTPLVNLWKTTETLCVCQLRMQRITSLCHLPIYLSNPP